MDRAFDAHTTNSDAFIKEALWSRQLFQAIVPVGTTSKFSSLELLCNLWVGTSKTLFLAPFWLSGLATQPPTCPFRHPLELWHCVQLPLSNPSSSTPGAKELRVFQIIPLEHLSFTISWKPPAHSLVICVINFLQRSLDQICTSSTLIFHPIHPCSTLRR